MNLAFFISLDSTSIPMTSKSSYSCSWEKRSGRADYYWWVVFKHKNTSEKAPNDSFSHKSDFCFQLIVRYITYSICMHILCSTS